MKAHFPTRRFRRFSGRRRRIQECHDALQHVYDGSLVGIESRFEFVFERGELACEIARVDEQSAHLDEGANHEYAHLHRLRTIQNIGRHDGSVFGERERLVLHVSTALQDHSL